jgi:hypothetical protein
MLPIRTVRTIVRKTLVANAVTKVQRRRTCRAKRLADTEPKWLSTLIMQGDYRRVDGIARPAKTGRYHAKNSYSRSGVGSLPYGVRLGDASKRTIGV